MRRKHLLIIAALACLIGCLSKQDVKLERYYDIFRGRNYPDSLLSPLARYIERYHPDSAKKRQARIWLKIQDQEQADRLIFTRGFKLITLLEAEERCNYIRRHYLAVRLTKSEDTLKKASMLLANRVYLQLTTFCPLRSWASSVVYLYESVADFDQQKFFSRAEIRLDRRPVVEVRP